MKFIRTFTKRYSGEWNVEFVHYTGGGFADACTQQAVQVTLSEGEVQELVAALQAAKQVRR